MPRVTDFVEGPVTPIVEAVRQLQAQSLEPIGRLLNRANGYEGPQYPDTPALPTDSQRIAALEARVAELERSLAETRRLTLGARFAHSPDSEDRP